jgi:hypothetical protein
MRDSPSVPSDLIGRGRGANGLQLALDLMKCATIGSKDFRQLLRNVAHHDIEVAGPVVTELGPQPISSGVTKP